MGSDLHFTQYVRGTDSDDLKSVLLIWDLGLDQLGQEVLGEVTSDRVKPAARGLSAVTSDKCGVQDFNRG